MKKVIGISLLCLATLMMALPGCTADAPGYIVIASSETPQEVRYVPVAANGGVTNHGALTGLADDDHPQYHNDARGDARYYTQVALNAGQLDSRYYTEGETDAEIATHAALTTGTHGVGTGTITSVSTANKNIYVDKEATGAADGTSWADAFTTIQAAVDSMEDLIIHAYTIIVRDGTKKTGTADQNLLNHLVDDGNSQFVAGDVGKRVFNVDDGTWGVVTAFVDAGDLTLAGDTFPAGNEDYVIEATPYRETVHLNDDPASYPSHLILGSLVIRAEYYWYATADAQANAGEILDADVDFTNVELGDTVLVFDRNGVTNRCQDYEVGTVDDISQLAFHIVRTTLTKTPTTLWEYVIVKTEISGSDDGTNTGTARDNLIKAIGMNNVAVYGFYGTFSDRYAIDLYASRGWLAEGIILENCDGGITCRYFSHCDLRYGAFRATVANFYGVDARDNSTMAARYVLVDSNSHGFYALNLAMINTWWCYIDNANRGFSIYRMSGGSFTYGTISANVNTGGYARYNSTIAAILGSNNNATIPEDPAGTVEGAFID